MYRIAMALLILASSACLAAAAEPKVDPKFAGEYRTVANDVARQAVVSFLKQQLAQLPAPPGMAAKYAAAIENQVKKSLTVVPATLVLKEDGSYEFTRTDKGAAKTTKGKWGAAPALRAPKDGLTAISLINDDCKFIVSAGGVIVSNSDNFSSASLDRNDPIFALQRAAAKKNQK